MGVGVPVGMGQLRAVIVCVCVWQLSCAAVPADCTLLAKPSAPPCRAALLPRPALPCRRPPQDLCHPEEPEDVPAAAAQAAVLRHLPRGAQGGGQGAGCDRGQVAGCAGWNARLQLLSCTGTPTLSVHHLSPPPALMQAPLLACLRSSLLPACLQVFISEQQLYGGKELERHMKGGDTEGPMAVAGFKGHPECRWVGGWVGWRAGWLAGWKACEASGSGGVPVPHSPSLD